VAGDGWVVPWLKSKKESMSNCSVLRVEGLPPMAKWEDMDCAVVGCEVWTTARRWCCVLMVLPLSGRRRCRLTRPNHTCRCCQCYRVLIRPSGVVDKRMWE